MDPNEALERIDELASAALWDAPDLDELVESLLGWIERGGFDPDWEAWPVGAAYVRMCEQHPG